MAALRSVSASASLRLRRSRAELAPTKCPSAATASRTSSSEILAAGAKSSRIVTSFWETTALTTSERCASARICRPVSANVISSRARARRASPSSFSDICCSESSESAAPCSLRPRLSRMAVSTPMAPKVVAPVTRTTAASRAPIEKFFFADASGGAGSSSGPSEDAPPAPASGASAPTIFGAAKRVGSTVEAKLAP